MAVNALDQKVTVGMFLNSMKGRFTRLLASTMTPQEKLNEMIKEMEKDVQNKRVLAREIGAQMRALSDPDTKELEPLEALQARRKKLIEIGGQIVNDASRMSQIGQIQQEIKALNDPLSAQQATYDTLKESYTLAKNDYQQALAALEQVKSNGPAILSAIEAHKAALAQREKVKSQTQIDTSFMNQLTGELNKAKAELRTDAEIDNDLDATNSFSVDAELAKMDAQTVDAGLMAEFQAAAAAAKK